MDSHEQWALTKLELGLEISRPQTVEITAQYGVANRKSQLWMQERSEPNPHSLQNEIMQLQHHQQRLA